MPLWWPSWFSKKMESAIEKVDYVKIEFSSIYQNGETEKKDRDFCTRSASAQFHPGLTEVT